MTGEMARAKILDLMGERSMSLAEFSARLTLTPEVIAARLGGRGALTLSELAKMARVLGVPLDELTEGAWFGCGACGAFASEPGLIVHSPSCAGPNRERLEMLSAVPR